MQHMLVQAEFVTAVRRLVRKAMKEGLTVAQARAGVEAVLQGSEVAAKEGAK